jgi:gluconate kinase
VSIFITSLYEGAGQAGVTGFLHERIQRLFRVADIHFLLENINITKINRESPLRDNKKTLLETIEEKIQENVIRI